MLLFAAEKQDVPFFLIFRHFLSAGGAGPTVYPTMSLLVNISDQSKKLSWPVAEGGETFIGRTSQCGVCLEDNRASRKHCVIAAGPDGFSVRDLNSANGTFVNGRRVLRSALKAGDRLRVGLTELEFRVETPGDNATTRMMAAAETAPAPAQQPPLAAVEVILPPVPTEAVPVPVPAPVGQRKASRVAGAPAAAPRLPDLLLEFCARCSGSIASGALSSGRARLVDGELLCAECLSRHSTETGAVPVAERSPGPLVPAGLRPTRTAPAAKPATKPGSKPKGHPAVRPKSAQPKIARLKTTRPKAAAARLPATQTAAPVATLTQRIWAWGRLGLALSALILCLGELAVAWAESRPPASPAGAATGLARMGISYWMLAVAGVGLIALVWAAVEARRLASYYRRPAAQRVPVDTVDTVDTVD
jgi:predicted component of type VI protein secretion system